MSESSGSKQPIRGWLLVYAIFLWASPFLNFITLVVGAFMFYHAQLETKIVTIQSFVGLVADIILIVLFIGRKRLFVKVVLWYETYALAIETLYTVIRTNSHEGILMNLLGCAIILLIILYMIYSKRVKNTFVV